MSKLNDSRRDFLKLAGIGALSASAFKILASPSQAFAADPGPMSPKDPMAISLGYVTDATKVDVKKWPKRAGPAGAKQFCHNCMFYQPKGDAAKAGGAPCQIFAGKTVTHQGWCNSWTQSPTAKS